MVRGQKNGYHTYYRMRGSCGYRSLAGLAVIGRYEVPITGGTEVATIIGCLILLVVIGALAIWAVYNDITGL